MEGWSSFVSQERDIHFKLRLTRPQAATNVFYAEEYEYHGKYR